MVAIILCGCVVCGAVIGHTVTRALKAAGILA